MTALAFGGPVWSSGYDDHSIPPVRGGGNQAYHTVCHFAAIGDTDGAGASAVHGWGAVHRCKHARGAECDDRGRCVPLAGGGRHGAAADGAAFVADAYRECADCCAETGRYVNIGFPARTEEQWFHLLAWLDEHGLVGGPVEVHCSTGAVLRSSTETPMRYGRWQR